MHKMADDTPRPLIRRRDQPTVAALAALALAFLAAAWLWHWWRAESYVEYDQLPHRAAQFQVDVNTADVAELSMLPDIGDTIAQRIVEHRRTKGRFDNADELLEVAGIGPRTLESLRPYLAPFDAKSP